MKKKGVTISGLSLSSEMSHALRTLKFIIDIGILKFKGGLKKCALNIISYQKKTLANANLPITVAG